MSNIIIETSRIKVCQYLYDLCDYCGYEREWTDSLWQDIILDSRLYEELVYYLSNHTLMDKICVEGYSLTDLYFFQMNKYTLLTEIGKNPVECNKDRMVLNAFNMMAGMLKNPEKYIRLIEEGKGEDRL